MDDYDFVLKAMVTWGCPISRTLHMLWKWCQMLENSRNNRICKQPRGTSFMRFSPKCGTVEGWEIEMNVLIVYVILCDCQCFMPSWDLENTTWDHLVEHGTKTGKSARQASFSQNNIGQPKGTTDCFE